MTGWRGRKTHRAQRTMQPHRGALILVFGILGLALCVIFGIAAWAMGNRDLREIGEGSRMLPSASLATRAIPDWLISLPSSPVIFSSCLTMRPKGILLKSKF